MRIARLATVSAVVAAFVMTLFSMSLAAEKKAEKQLMNEKDIKPFVDGIIKAYGGKDAINAVKGVYVKANIKADVRGDYGTYIRYMQRPDKLRVEINYSRSSELRILNGRDGWRGENDIPLKKVTDFQYNAMLYQFKQLDIPHAVASNECKLKWSGEAIVGGKHADILSYSDKDTVAMDVYVDSKSFYIIKVVGYFNVNGQMATLSAEFSDFRKVGGTMMPYSITNYSQDMMLGTNVVEECRINPQMKPGLFRP